MKISLIATLILSLGYFGLNAQYEVDAEETAAADDIVAVAADDARFSTLTSLLQEAELAPVISNSDNLTMFAPTDEAFEQVPDETLAAIRENPDMLRQVLLHHIVVGEASAADVAGMENAQTAAGLMVDVNASGDGVMVDNANVIETDINTSNGIIHVIDQVLIPEGR